MSDDFHAAARTLARFARVLEHACDDLSLPQYRVLLLLSQGEERASQLAGSLALAKPTITAAVDGLVERGLLERGEVAGDRRAIHLRLTAAGRKAMKTAEDAMAERLAPLFGRLADPAAALAAIEELGRVLHEAVAEARRSRVASA